MIRVLELGAADESDLAAILALYRNEWWTRERTLEETRAGLAGSAVVLVARDGRRLVGLARVLSDFVWKALVFDVVVSPAARGRGIGERLLEAVLAHPRLADVRHFELYCRPEMEPFYERFGFSAEVSGVRLMRRPARAER